MFSEETLPAFQMTIFFSVTEREREIERERQGRESSVVMEELKSVPPRLVATVMEVVKSVPPSLVATSHLRLQSSGVVVTVTVSF